MTISGIKNSKLSAAKMTLSGNHNYFLSAKSVFLLSAKSLILAKNNMPIVANIIDLISQAANFFLARKPPLVRNVFLSTMPMSSNNNSPLKKKVKEERKR